VTKLKTELSEIEARLRQLEEKSSKAASTGGAAAPAPPSSPTTTTTATATETPLPAAEALPPVSQATQIELHPEGTTPTSDSNK